MKRTRLDEIDIDLCKVAIKYMTDHEFNDVLMNPTETNIQKFLKYLHDNKMLKQFQNYITLMTDNPTTKLSIFQLYKQIAKKENKNEFDTTFINMAPKILKDTAEKVAKYKPYPNQGGRKKTKRKTRTRKRKTRTRKRKTRKTRKTQKKRKRTKRKTRTKRR